MTAALYSEQVPKTRRIGRQLGDALRRLPGRPEISVIAHSLSCRVALEAMRSFVDDSLDRACQVSKICLRAATVPT